jgi:hypothetical protein
MIVAQNAEVMIAHLQEHSSARCFRFCAPSFDSLFDARAPSLAEPDLNLLAHL